MMTVILDDGMNSEVVIFGEYVCFDDKAIHMDQLTDQAKSLGLSKKGASNLLRFCQENLPEKDEEQFFSETELSNIEWKAVARLTKRIENIWLLINRRANIKELAQNPFVEWGMFANLYKRQKELAPLGKKLIHEMLPKAPLSVVEEWLQDDVQDIFCLLGLVDNPLLTEEHMLRLVAFNSSAIKQALSKRNELPQSVVSLLAKEDDADILIELSKRELPLEIIQVLLDKQIPEVTLSVVQHQVLPQPLIEEIVALNDYDVLAEIAKKPMKEIGLEISKKLADCPYQLVRANLAQSTYATTIVKNLSRDIHPMVRASVGLNKSVKDSGVVQSIIFQALLHDDDPAVQLYLAEHCDDVNVLEALSQHPCLHVRLALSKRQDLSSATIENLAKDKSIQVKVNLAKRKDLPLSIVNKLREDKSKSVIDAITSNVNYVFFKVTTKSKS